MSLLPGLRCLTGLAALALLALPGVAGAGPERLRDPQVAATAAEADRANLMALLGKPVLATDGEELGRVEDIALDPRGGRARLLVLVLPDGRQVAVDFARVSYHAGRDELTLTGLGRTAVADLPDYAGSDADVSLNRPNKR